MNESLTGLFLAALLSYNASAVVRPPERVRESIGSFAAVTGLLVGATLGIRLVGLVAVVAGFCAATRLFSIFEKDAHAAANFHTLVDATVPNDA